MNIGNGQVAELLLEDGCPYLRVTCPPNLIPTPGQYLLASDGSDSPLPVPLFYADSAPQGFLAVAPTNAAWSPGRALYLRGPLGRGFTLPSYARRVALVAIDDAPVRLRGLIQPALKQDAAVVLVSSSAPDTLPDDVEVQPLSALTDILDWADYVAFDLSRENMPPWKDRLRKQNHRMAGMSAQALLRTPVPCGGIAECGVCAITLKADWRLACKDGPVFDVRDL